MPTTIQRKKRLNVNILETGEPTTHSDIRCRNCKEWSFLVQQQTDRKNLFCTRCGALTPIRSLKHSRGLAVPSIQQSAAETGQLLQPRDVKPGSRTPRGIHTTPPNPIVNALMSKGFQIIDSQYIEPTPHESEYNK